MSLIATIIVILAPLALFIRDEFFGDQGKKLNRRVSRAVYALIGLSGLALLYNWYSDQQDTKGLRDEVVTTKRVMNDGFSNLSSNLAPAPPLTFEFYVNGTVITKAVSNVVHARAGDRWIETAVVMLPNREEKKDICITARNLGRDQAKDASLIARVPKASEFTFSTGWQPIGFSTRTPDGIAEDNSMNSAVLLVGSPVHPAGYIGGAPIHLSAPTNTIVTTRMYVEAMASGAEKKRLDLILIFNPEAGRVVQK